MKLFKLKGPKKATFKKKKKKRRRRKTKLYFATYESTVGQNYRKLIQQNITLT